MKRKLIFATGNEGKMIEIRMLLADLDLEVLSMKEAGIDLQIIEDGSTFAENALIKARALTAACQELVLADDSGLVIDALGGEPGIYSSRYMGEDTSYRIKNARIVERLEGVPEEKRTARFVCAIAAVFPDGREYLETGVMEGFIGREERGENGFGYDPIFFLPEYGLSSAELPLDEKNRISHRGKALEAMKTRLQAELQKAEARGK